LIACRGKDYSTGTTILKIIVFTNPLTKKNPHTHPFPTTKKTTPPPPPPQYKKEKKSKSQVVANGDDCSIANCRA